MAPASGSGSQTIVVTQRPPDRRVDVTSADGAVDATFRVDGRGYACTDPPGDDPWRCEPVANPVAEGAFDAEAVAELTDALAGATDHYDFTVERREVAGTGARCLVTSLRPGQEADPSLGDEGSLCIADSGAILLVDRPTGTLRASDYTTDVPGDAFDLPADPGTDPGTGGG